jgi:D-alanine-D-alanine ligase
MKVAFAYNVKHNKPSEKLEEQIDLEFDSPQVIKGITAALESLGHEVIHIEADENAFNKLQKNKDKIDIVFNIAEGMWGEARETQIPLYCEVLKIPYTHSGPTTHTISLDKSFTNLILKGANGINVPESRVVNSKNYTIPASLKFPLIVKPNNEGSSKGIFDKNVVNNKQELDKRIKIVSENFKKEVLVEEFIDGREFTVAVMGNGNNVKVLPIIEQKFDFLPKGMNKIASFELKWLYEDKLENLTDAYDCPAKLTSRQQNEIEETSKLVFKLLDVKDVARLDYRMNQNGKLYFIEINTLPGINLDDHVISYLPTAAAAAGMRPKELIGKILDLAANRYGIK